jgi:hypothetical protein
LITLLLGTVIPLWSYAILRRLGRFSIADSAALAAHYGSVSVVTFIASKGLLDRLQVPYEGFMPTLVALLEVPAIVVALLLASMLTGSNTNWQRSVREIITSKSVILLLGGLVVGLLSGHEGLTLVEPFFVAPYNGILALFLLEMGMVTARRLGDLRQVGGFLVGFGLLMPVLHGTLAVWLGTLAGLSLGGSTVLGAMAASASYIAAPAAVRLALPQANPSYYLTAALGITFPFNITLGIPLYYSVARWLHG